MYISYFKIVFCFIDGNQAECDELAQRAEILKEENASLRAELSRARNEYEQALAQNAALKVWIDVQFYKIQLV